MDYRQKYLKYKEKYLEAKNQSYNQDGGGSDISDDERFDEVYFWGTQDLEHFKIYILASSSDDLLNTKELDSRLKDMAPIMEESRRLASLFKSQAQQLFKRWHDILNKIFVANGIELKKIYLTKQQLDLVNSKYLNELPAIIALWQDSINYKQSYYDAQKQGHWIGWLLPAFSQHTKMEAEYPLRKLNNQKISVEEEIAFYNKNAEDLFISKNLLNPTEINDIDRADQLIVQATTKITLIDSINYNKELQQYFDGSITKLKTLNLLSAINPEIAAHSERETQRAQYVLGRLGPVS